MLIPMPLKTIGCLCMWTAAGIAQDSNVDLAKSGRTVLTYHATLASSPDPEREWLARSGFIHPVRTPSGKAVTEAFPIKQTHQHGLMFAWTSGQYDSRPMDFWNSEAKQGRVRHREVIESDEERLVVRLEHVAEDSDPEVRILEETWRVSLVSDPKDHVFDLDLRQTNVTETPLLVKEYHYGGLCIRGTDRWKGKATMLTSERKGREDGNHSRPKWCAMFGEIDGQTCGIAVLDHPSNDRHPIPVRLHPSNPYFCLAPMVLGPFQITREQPYQARFRIVAFDGPADADRLDGQWERFSRSVSDRH